jgi:hypothetical protein
MHWSALTTLPLIASSGRMCQRWRTSETTDRSPDILFGFRMCLLAQLFPLMHMPSSLDLWRTQKVFQEQKHTAFEQTQAHSQDTYLHVICHLLENTCLSFSTNISTAAAASYDSSSMSAQISSVRSTNMPDMPGLAMFSC